ncbi:MAG: nucleoside-diphosphate sugar epimerase/dehydratase [Planctomycetota bacterium]
MEHPGRSNPRSPLFPDKNGSLVARTSENPRTPRERRTGPGTLLVGTALSVRQLLPSLLSLDPAPSVLGCLLPKPAILPLPVLGGFDQLETLVQRPEVQQVLVSLPAVMDDQLRPLAATLDRLGVAWRYLPPLADQLAGHTTPRNPKRSISGGASGGASGGSAGVDPTQLIDRQPRPLDEPAIRRTVTDKTVLITGAGGSIGSELAHVVARFKPSRLVLVERSENSLFEIDRQIARRYPELIREAVLHDVTQADRTLDLMQRIQPAVVFHAAAHKHVPMMENHPTEAVENNFYGTRSIADAADRAGCERFVMISTDKAVNPSSVMGASKRLAELYIRHLNQNSGTTFCMVRFGNVLGSACSLIPIWTDQLSRGGPITVTHREMTRYFMTIPEAAGLVLQAGAYAEGGEVFLLDMGQPIRILDMADRFLRLQGFAPDVDVQIEITGPRPGEKLFEELAYTGEDMLPTPHESIRIWQAAQPEPAQIQQIVSTFDRLRDKSADGSRRWRDTSSEAVVTALRSLLPEMVTPASAAG